jgi:hypothetical protein
MLKGRLLFLYEELLRFCLLRAMPSPTSRQQTWAAVLETLLTPFRRRLKQNVQMIFDPPPSNSIAERPTLLEELAAEGQRPQHSFFGVRVVLLVAAACIPDKSHISQRKVTK